MEYKDKLEISSEYKFGIELEFTNINIAYLYTQIKDKIPLQFTIGHNNETFDFNNYWCLDQDGSVTKVEHKNESNRYMGGELSSKIYTDTYETWNEIKTVCNILKENNCIADEHCAFHIHISNNKIEKNKKFYEGLYKLIALYEDDLKLFYMGDKYKIRKHIDKYAIPIKNKIVKKLDKIDFNNYESIYEYLLEPEFYTYASRNGIHMYPDKNEIEIRYPNGTINPNIVQNNTNFSLKLFDALLNNKIDIEKLDYSLKRQKDDINLYGYSRNFHPIAFNELVDTISKDVYDKRNFKSQYKKVLETK